MKPARSNFNIYSPTLKTSVSRTANIGDLLKRNKEEQKKEKITKFYALAGFGGLVFIFGLFIFL